MSSSGKRVGRRVVQRLAVQRHCPFAQAGLAQDVAEVQVGVDEGRVEPDGLAVGHLGGRRLLRLQLAGGAVPVERGGVAAGLGRGHLLRRRELHRLAARPDLEVHQELAGLRVPARRSLVHGDLADDRGDAQARQRQLRGQPAVDRYLRFLGSGSSRPSIDILRDAGVDMTTPAPIQAAMDRFDALLDELEAMEA